MLDQILFLGLEARGASASACQLGKPMEDLLVVPSRAWFESQASTREGAFRPRRLVL